MNEQIKTMWEESTGSVWPAPGKFTAGEYDYNLEKFAELIIRECITVINQPNGVGDDDVIRITKDVEKHFGVEE